MNTSLLINEFINVIEPLIKDDKDNELLIELFRPCIIEFILYKRITVLILIEEIFNVMRSSKGSDTNLINTILKKCNDLIMNWNNSIQEINSGIDDILISNFNNSYRQLIGTIPKEITGDIIAAKIDKRIKEWFTRIKIEKTLPQDFKPIKTQNIKISHTADFRKNESNKFTDIDETLTDKTLQKGLEMLNVMYNRNVPTNVKLDKERFTYIFSAFENDKVNPIQINQASRKIIEELWYGPNITDPDIDSFVGYANMCKKSNNSFSLNINKVKPAILSRVILQIFITALVMKSELYQIERALLYTIDKIGINSENYKRSYIFHDPDNKIPNQKIVSKINEVFQRIHLNPSLSYILTEWETIKFPKINYSGLVNFLENMQNNDKKNKDKIWLVRQVIGSIVMTQKRLTIDKLAEMILQKIPYKILTYEQIKSNLKFV